MREKSTMSQKKMKPDTVIARIRASLTQAFDAIPGQNSKLMKRYGKRSIVVGNRSDNKVDWRF
jgi:hypothetical protein